MYILNVEKRNETIKAKQLRKSGKVPVGVCGGDLQETMLLQVNKGDVAKLLRSKSKGGRVTMEMGGKKMSALLKEIDYDSFAGEVQNLTFQKLLEDEVVSSTVKLVLINKECTQLMVQVVVDEIPYKALPLDLIEKIEIDVNDIKDINSVKIEDLPFAKNEKVEILLPMDTVLINMVESIRQVVEAPTGAGVVTAPPPAAQA
ncbi:MAG: hypothetical protein RR846_02240 [Oscillospiraceae bacterium]